MENALAKLGHDAAILIRRRSRVLLKKSREITLGAKAKILRNAADFVLVLAQPADRSFHPQRIDIDAGTDAGAIPKQMIEVRPGQAAAPGRFIEIDSFGRRFAHMPQRPADAIIAESARLVQPRSAVAPVRKSVSDVETKIENQLLKFVMPA